MTITKLLALALGNFPLAAATPRLAEACGPYGMTPERIEALKLANAERERLAKLRSQRAKRCVVASIQKISEEERQAMSDLPLDAKQRRSVAIHYPRFSEDNYRVSLYMDWVTLNRFGATWDQLNAHDRFAGADAVLRPAGDGEWMVVHNFKAECPAPRDATRTHIESFDLP